MKMLVLAYGFIWVAVMVYVALIGRRVVRIDQAMDELRRRLERRLEQR